MPIRTQKIPKQILGFFSISVAWTSTMIIYAVYQVIKYGKTEDMEMMLFWSALFVFIGWVIFIIFPLTRLDHSRKMFQTKIFPFVTGIYAGGVYTLLIGGLFRSPEVIMMFLVWAIVIGVIFGFTYSLLISSNKLLRLVNRKPALQLLSPLSPLIFLGLFWWLLPSLFPTAVFRFMPGRIQRSIVARTLPKFRKGDRLSSLKGSLPGYFGDDDANGNWAFESDNELFNCKIEVKNDTIQKLDIRFKK